MKKRKKIKPILARNSEELAEALGLSQSAAIEWQVRYEVNKEIIKAFELSNLTMTELAKRAGTSRARISRIIKMDTTDISLDVLFRILGATGQKISFRFDRAG